MTGGDATIVSGIGILILILTAFLGKAPLSMWATWSRNADTKKNVQKFSLVWFALFGLILTLAALWKLISGN